jgi:prevent-host-death family protein
MTRKVTATEAKASLLALLEEAAAGEDVEITKHGRLVARLTSATAPHGLKGRFAGVAATAADEERMFATGVGWDLE